MSLTESKSNLARLLSTEDLIVEQRSGVPSAFFDTKSRLLVVPKFKDDLSNDTLDLFLSHEVGHALETPVNWADECKSKGIKASVTNVVEDNRIERLVKSKYPGLRAVYSRAYKQLNEMDFFGMSKIDFEEINLIDKINLTSKLGYIPAIVFSEEEQKLFDKVNETKTYSDVLKVSLELQGYMKKEFELKLQEMDEEERQGGVSGEEYDFQIEFDENGYDGDEGEGSLSDTYDSFMGDSDESGQKKSIEKLLDEYLESSTAESAEEKIKELYSDSNRQSVYVDVPLVKVSDYVIPYKTVFDRLKKEVDSSFFSKKAYNLFKKEASPIVSYLIKEFLLKRNAEGRKKVKVSKTGDIHFGKLFAYKVSDDIFKRNEIIPKSQSHGLVFFLDWSGSMTNCLNDTIKQLITMLMFCKKMSIPFEVYAFTSAYFKEGVDRNIENTVEPNIMNTTHIGVVKLLNLFSSKMSNNEFVSACNIMLGWNEHYFVSDSMPVNCDWYETYKYKARVPQWLSLGNTPLNHTILIAKKVVEQFKVQNKVQKINSIFLTDGDSHNVQFSTLDRFDHMRHMDVGTSYYNVYLRDRETKTTLKVNKGLSRMSETNACVSFLKEISDFKIFGFRLISPNELRTCYAEFFGFNADVSELRKKLNRENCIRSNNTTFDEFYIIKSNAIDIDDGKIADFGEKESLAGMTKKFQKAVGSKINNRIFLKKFIEFIS